MKLENLNINFPKLFDSSDILLGAFELSGKILYLNEAWIRLINIRPSQMEGSLIYSLVHSDDQIKLQNEFKVISATKAKSNLSCRMSNSIGSDSYYRLSLFFQEGKVIVLAQELKSESDSIRILDEKISNLQAQNSDLENFVNLASHELRAPLRGVQLLSSWIDEEISKKKWDSLAGHLKNLKIRTERMDQLLEQLHEYCLIGKEQGPLSEVDIKKIISEIVGKISMAERRLSLKIEGHLPILNADAKAMETVFTKLIQNSLKHSNCANLYVTISAIEQGGMWKFSVLDNGNGIPQEYAERVFEVFKTLKPKDQVEGSGLGLSIVKKIVEKCGGKVWVDTQNLSGTKIEFTLPKK
jgi:hypothetical protein